MQTKAPHPADLLSPGEAPAWLGWYFALNQLKQLYRQGWLRAGIPPDRCESVAEHTFGVLSLAFWLGSQSGLDLERVAWLALVHDFGEIFAGDLTPGDGVPPGEKQARERAAVARVCAGLPGGAEWLARWEEFEAGNSPEARLVRQVDRLEMALQAAVYTRQGFFHLEQFIESARRELSDPGLLGMMSELDAVMDKGV